MTRVAAWLGVGVLLGWAMAELIDRAVARLLGTDALGRWWR